MTDIIEIEESSATRLRVTGVLADVTPTQTYAAFTDATLITRWWPETAIIDARVGGSLELRWPERGWTLRGRYLDLTPDRSVSFSWAWDHTPDSRERIVTVLLSEENGGTRVRLSHGDYGPGDEEERSGHLAGWQHFLPRIPDAVLG